MESLAECRRRYENLLKDARFMERQHRHVIRGLLAAQEDERKLISRELHDDISQTLAGINIQLTVLTKESTYNREVFKKKVERVRKLVEKSVDIVHHFARKLRPTLLDHMGLVPALHAYMKTLTKQSGLLIQFKVFTGQSQLSNPKETAIYRLVQSALTNVVKHAKATQAHVILQKIPGAITLEINDNGAGFQTADHLLRRKRYPRLGLIIMRERAEMFGGTFQIDSVIGTGATIRIQIPVEGSAK